MKKPETGEPWVITKAACHTLISRYIDWHSIAIAVGNEISVIEHRWLKDTGLLNGEDKEELHEHYAEPEQQIASFESVAASCSGNPESDQFRGVLIINSMLVDGQSMTRTFLQEGSDSYSISKQPPDNNGTTNGFTALPKHYLSQLPFNKKYYQQVIDQLNEINASNLKFTEDVVDLWFDWPAGILMTSIQDINTMSSRNGNVNNFGTNTTYKTAFTKTDIGVRLSSQYAGIPTNTPPYFKSEEEVNNAKQAYTTRCIEDIWFCWKRTHSIVPYHYEIDQKGKISIPILDDQYLAELEKLLQNNFGLTNNYDEFAKKMSEHVKEERKDKSIRLDFQPLEAGLKVLNGKTLSKGTVYTEILAPLTFSNQGQAHQYLHFEGTAKTLKYLGKKPCNSEDSDNACAHIEYRLGNIDPNQGIVVVEMAMDLILEPHKLILHKVDYELRRTDFTSEDQATVKSKQHYTIAIQYSYEDLPQ